LGTPSRLCPAILPPNQAFRALGFERELQQFPFTGKDAREGLTAYVEKRAANFKGK